MNVRNIFEKELTVLPIFKKSKNRKNWSLQKFCLPKENYNFAADENLRKAIHI